METKKLTKIVATIGPACDSPEMIKNLIKTGVDVFRFNFKHNSIEWHDERIKRVNQISEKLGIPVATLIDLQGPEIRVNMPGEEIIIKNNELLLFGEEVFNKNIKGFSISHPQIINSLKEGQKVLADDGTLRFFVEKIQNKTYLRSQSSGVLKNHKNLNIPGIHFPFSVLVGRDFEGLKLAQRNKIDYVALSFVRSSSDIKIVKKEMKKYELKAKTIAKIENKKALDNLDGIIRESDGIMVARGDLGVEIAMEQVPYYQKIIIKKCIEKGIPVITATQMLQSMVNNPVPTRAEISDIANAVYDLSDAVMLSAETSVGKYPLESVEMMKKTIIFNENKNVVDCRKKFNFQLKDKEALLCDTAYNLYLQQKNQKRGIKGFLIFTHTGRTACLISRYHPLIPIFAFTPNQNVCKSLIMNFGIISFSYNLIARKSEVTRVDIKKAIKILLKRNLLKKGDNIIALHGDYWAIKGQTSTLNLLTV
jgi:pyruvate kinase